MAFGVALDLPHVLEPTLPYRRGQHVLDDLPDPFDPRVDFGYERGGARRLPFALSTDVASAFFTDGTAGGLA